MGYRPGDQPLCCTIYSNISIEDTEYINIIIFCTIRERREAGTLTERAETFRYEWKERKAAFARNISGFGEADQEHLSRLSAAPPKGRGEEEHGMHETEGSPPPECNPDGQAPLAHRGYRKRWGGRMEWVPSERATKRRCRLPPPPS